MNDDPVVSHGRRRRLVAKQQGYRAAGQRQDAPEDDLAGALRGDDEDRRVGQKALLQTRDKLGAQPDELERGCIPHGEGLAEEHDLERRLTDLDDAAA